MRFIPEEQLLDIVYLILSHQNSTERSSSNPNSPMPALSGEVDLTTAAEFPQA